MQIRGTISGDPTELDANIMEALREVLDPEIGISVVELGMIRKIEHKPDLTEITMILTTPFCPLAGYLTEKVRQRAQEVVGHPVSVILGEESWDPSMMEGDEWGLDFI
jgi:metal-sulfur cluster biosynthetic enzyme